MIRSVFSNETEQMTKVMMEQSFEQLKKRLLIPKSVNKLSE